MIGSAELLASHRERLTGRPTMEDINLTLVLLPVNLCNVPSLVTEDNPFRFCSPDCGRCFSQYLVRGYVAIAGPMKPQIETSTTTEK